MFVVIDNQDMDALKVEDWINRTRDANGGVISPEFAMEVLGKTNHFAHIKKVLKNITKACSDENGELVKDKVLEYKEFLLSSVDGREMSPQALEVLQKLAEKGGLGKEFCVANDKIKFYEVKGGQKPDVKIIKSLSEFFDLTENDLIAFFDIDKVHLFRDLSPVKVSRFKEGCYVSLSGGSLPKNADLSTCSKVDLIGCDLERFNFKFREDAEVDLSGAKNLPKELDLSMCSKVGLRGCDLSRVEKIKFKEGAEVDLGIQMINKRTILPKELDVSMCSKVDLSYADNLPKDLDLSMCSKVDLSGCDLEGVERIKFRDKAQEKEFMDGARGFNGKVEYVGDVKGKNMVNGNGGKEM